MSTIAEVVNRTRQKLSGFTTRDRVNVLNAAINSSVTSVTVTYTIGSETTVGAVIEIDYEQMMIVSIATNTLTVIRGWNGTTPASHSINAVIYIEPVFPASIILHEVTDELCALPQSIFQTSTTVLTFSSGVNQVDLSGATGTVYKILSADRESFDGASYPSFKPNLRLIRNADTSDFPSGYAVAIDGGLSYGQSAVVRVVYAKSLTISSLNTSTDLQSVVGLPITAEDILVLGAGSRVLYSKESARVGYDRQGSSRFAEEVPVESNARQAQRWRAEADRRIGEEAMRLVGLWGISGV